MKNTITFRGIPLRYCGRFEEPNPTKENTVEKMTRDQLAVSATEEDLIQWHRFDRTMSREENRYAYADAMIKARGDGEKADAVPDPESQLKPITGWIVIRKGLDFRSCLDVVSGVFQSADLATEWAKRRSFGDRRSYYSIASIGPLR